MPRARYRFAVPLFLLFYGLPAAVSPAQRPLAPDAGCVEQKGTYHCNLSSLKLALEGAHTLAVEAAPRDRAALSQLQAFVGSLGKAPVEAGGPADLTLVLVPANAPGIDLGPMDHDLATLRIYAPSGMSSRGTLLWAEVLRGSGDRAWPAQVHALLEQFGGRLHAR